MTNARGLLLFGALIESAPYLVGDPRVVQWTAEYENLAKKVHESNKRDRYTGAPLISRSDVQVDTRRQR